MAVQYDLIIRGGLVADGTGAEPRPADIGISQDVIQAVGEVVGDAQEVIDATGLLVTPDFIDLQAHYDGQAVRAMTSHPAGIIGFRDRGVIAPGYKADINIIDHHRLTLHPPEIIDNLPGGGRRLDQRASGYRYMLVSREVVTRDDQPTGARPGQLVRGARAVPAAPIAA